MGTGDGGGGNGNVNLKVKMGTPLDVSPGQRNDAAMPVMDYTESPLPA